MGVGGSPDPPDNIHNDLTPPICSNIPENAADSDDDEMEINHYEGYAPLPLGPNDENELIPWDNSSDSSDDDETDEPDPMAVIEEPAQCNSNIPPIETVDTEVSRELWTKPRDQPNIEMDSEKAQEVMSAMANFSLPPSSIPEWAHSITEDEWKLHIASRINKSPENR